MTVGLEADSAVLWASHMSLAQVVVGPVLHKAVKVPDAQMKKVHAH